MPFEKVFAFAAVVVEYGAQSLRGKINLERREREREKGGKRAG
jgi:hypothetical protein